MMTRFSLSYVPLSDAVTAGGNRIAKHVYSATGVFEKSTYYVRDASGNVMATYEIGSEEGEQSEAYRLIERPIYGSSRVGLDVTEVEWIVATDCMGQPIVEVAPPLTANTYTRELGHKQYEVSNHLGNVLVVVNDIKMTVISGNTISGYRAKVISATDYSPFGVVLNGRTYTSESGYRYGFNGQEKETEITGSESHTSAEYWMYDSRLGRRWQLDPKPLVSFTLYSCLMDSPLLFCDPHGDTSIFRNINNGEELGRIDDSSRMNNVLINPDIYNQVMCGATQSDFTNDQECANNKVDELHRVATEYDESHDDGFCYISCEEEQFLSIGLTGGSGTLELRARFDNGAVITIDSWGAHSGNSNGTLRCPAGSFKVDGLMRRQGEETFCRDDACFSADLNDRGNIWDPDLNRNRSAIEIHPDGQVDGNWEQNNGTAGCIGLQESPARCESFYKALSSYLTNPRNPSMTIHVTQND